MVATGKKALAESYNYDRISAYFELNFGRIADVKKEREFPDIPPADKLLSGSPTIHQTRTRHLSRPFLIGQSFNGERSPGFSPTHSIKP